MELGCEFILILNDFILQRQWPELGTQLSKLTEFEINFQSQLLFS